VFSFLLEPISEVIGVNFAIFIHQATWRVVDPILRNVTPVHEYEPNIWGPKASAERIIFGASWRKRRPSSTMLWLRRHSDQGLQAIQI
jgi:hypothetical protein